MSNAIQIAGVAGGVFEANFGYRVTEGHDEVTGSFMAGDGISNPKVIHPGDIVRVPRD